MLILYIEIIQKKLGLIQFTKLKSIVKKIIGIFIYQMILGLH